MPEMKIFLGYGLHKMDVSRENTIAVTEKYYGAIYMYANLQRKHRLEKTSLPFCHYFNPPLILLSQVDKIIRFATCLIWLKFFLQKCKRFFILKEMHKLICTHDCYIFFTQNPLYFFSVSKYNFNFLCVCLLYTSLSPRD